jgi:hypothetical protein
MECITNGCDAATLKNLLCISDTLTKKVNLAHLGIISVHSVDFDVLFRTISFDMEDKWWINRRSVVVKARH